jgi:hypothetical protein
MPKRMYSITGKYQQLGAMRMGKGQTDGNEDPKDLVELGSGVSCHEERGSQCRMKVTQKPNRELQRIGVRCKLAARLVSIQIIDAQRA